MILSEEEQSEAEAAARYRAAVEVLGQQRLFELSTRDRQGRRMTEEVSMADENTEGQTEATEPEKDGGEATQDASASGDPGDETKEEPAGA